MAKSTAHEASGAEPLLSVEALRDRLGTPAGIHLGMVTMKGWSAGKMVTEPEYRKALAEFREAGTGKGGKNA